MQEKHVFSSLSLNFLWLQEEDWEGPNGTRLWGWAMQPVKEAEEFPQLGTEKTAAPWPEMDVRVVVSNDHRWLRKPVFYFKICSPSLSGWWFQAFSIFTLTWGMIQFDSYFQTG